MKKIAAAVQSTINDTVASANDRLAQARAEFNARQAEKAQAAAPTAQPEVEDMPAFSAEQEATMAAAQNLFATFRMPSITRLLCGIVFGLAVATGVGVIMGYAISALMIGAMAMTGSAFLANAIYIVGMIYTAYKGMRVTLKAAGYVVSGNVDKTFGGVTGTIGSWFKRQPQVIQVVQAAAPVTNGAFTPASA